uniref:Peptidase S1 domain-containing protein n=1 Tax=Sinocyclocheilus anshuiensis TaxID=1608454 RepID=A0A671KGT9_9TELE
CFASKSSLILTNSSISLSARVNVGIVNGKQAKPHSRPYMVSIQLTKRHVCGGFLISDEFVMTAAHCWKGYPEILTVVVGAHDLRKSEISDRMIKSLNNGCVFELQLQEKVKLNNNVKWISLPKEGDANMTTINHTVCQHKWGSKYFEASQMICAHGDGGSCKGDSGGPLVCGNTAAGVTSFVSIKLCNSPEHPNVYTKISAYLPWIHQIIRNIK